MWIIIDTALKCAALMQIYFKKIFLIEMNTWTHSKRSTKDFFSFSSKHSRRKYRQVVLSFYLFYFFLNGSVSFSSDFEDRMNKIQLIADYELNLMIIMKSLLFSQILFHIRIVPVLWAMKRSRENTSIMFMKFIPQK